MNEDDISAQPSTDSDISLTTPMKVNIEEIKYTIIEFEAPFFISIPDGDYSLNIGRESFGITVNRINKPFSIEKILKSFSVPNDEEITKYFEISYDKWSRFTYSRVSITFLGFFDDGNTPLDPSIPSFSMEQFKKKILKVFNRFIEVYRYYTRDFNVDRLTFSDIIFYSIYYIVDDKKLGPYSNMSVPDGGAAIFDDSSVDFPPRKADICLNEIIETLANDDSLDSDVIFIINSKDALFREDYRRAIIEGVIALEFVVSNFIRCRMQLKGINNDKKAIDEYLTAVGITNAIQFTIPTLLTADEFEKWDETLTSQCLATLRIRNKIIHQGLQQFDKNKVIAGIGAIEQMIGYIKKY